MRTHDFGDCCQEMKDALVSPATSMFRVEEDGHLYLRVGYMDTNEGRGWYGQPVTHCPFCGTEIQEPGRIRGLLPQMFVETSHPANKVVLYSALLIPAATVIIAGLVATAFWREFIKILETLLQAKEGLPSLTAGVAQLFLLDLVRPMGFVIAIGICGTGYYLIRKARSPQAAVMRVLVLATMAWVLLVCIIGIISLATLLPFLKILTTPGP